VISNAGQTGIEEQMDRAVDVAKALSDGKPVRSVREAVTEVQVETQ
jgi:hypothetical protein